MTTPTPIPQRLFRIALLALHLVRGLLIAAFRYPRMSDAQQRRARQRWSHQLLSILHIRLDGQGQPHTLPACCFIACNHISWLDIFVINAVVPAVFVSKSEVARWPLVGWLCTRVGTLYIERGRKSGARRANENISRTLEGGKPVAVCPEGTTTYGRELLPFHAALFQPAVDAGAAVLPVALRYVDAHGDICEAAGYVGDDSLLDSIWAIASTRRMTAKLAFAPPLDINGMTRRDAARATESVIAEKLGVPSPRHRAHATA